MGPVALLALLSGALFMTAADGSDPEPVEDPGMEKDPVLPGPDPQDPGDDIGATFDATAEGITIDVGDDETGRLASIIYVDTEDDPDNFIQTHEARFYLVPEDTDWSAASWETQNDIPGASSTNFELDDFEETFGLELLGTVPLGTEGFSVFPEQGKMADRLPDVTANRDLEVYYLEANTDGDDLITFLPEDFVVTQNGVPEVEVDANTTGTAGSDWFTTGADGIAVDGAGGDDVLYGPNANVSLDGGDGDDLIRATGADVVVEGGAGNDSLDAASGTVTGGAGDDSISLHEGTARGGAGDDSMVSYTDAAADLFGEEGDDRFTIFGEGSRAFGGAGDDFIGVNAGAAAFGEAGNDHLQVESGATAEGGAGDDLFTVWNQFRDEDGPATVTGGDGADTFDARVWNAVNGTADDIYMEVTDFDPAEDVLAVGVFQTTGVEVDTVVVSEAADGSFSDVTVTYTARAGQDPGIAVIRLSGTTGMTADQVVVLA
ncbi:hypothetical protein [uncultured Tateyamaria sp.]|uniref:calcium-binding protein n=1 Tax=uncultured Tateyamaria sp. TaxID=455651 RepID=UPI0026030E4C|nr:hypothetical protein [uncultured Tateyamaria sp.]